MSRTPHRRAALYSCHALAACLVALCLAPSASAQTTQGVKEPDPLKAINLLRTELVDAFNKGDVERLISHLDPDAVITWQNGEVTRGPQGLRAYYEKMMTGPNRVVAQVTADPVVDDRHIYGDWAVSWGNLHDAYVLTDGSSFRFDSRFTATIARRGDVWKITSFHASVSAFDNPILGVAVRKSSTWSGVIAGIIGLLVGGVIGRVIGKRKSAKV